MRSRLKILSSSSLLVIFFGIAQEIQAQPYAYRCSLEGIKDTWHAIELPDEIFRRLSPSMSDLRILGVTEAGDTIEAPYLLRSSEPENSCKEFQTRVINPSRAGGKYYFTLEMPSESISQLDLSFLQENFDWRLKLEGSQSLEGWTTISENYRVLSIKNDVTDYQFTRVVIPESRYRYLKLSVSSKEPCELRQATVSSCETKAGRYKSYPIRKRKDREDRKSKQSEIVIDLPSRVPVSLLRLHVAGSFDYYRPLSIMYLLDSVKTEKGWRYNFEPLSDGMITSFEKNEFRLNGTTLQRLRLVIRNGDNQPLPIDSLEVSGYHYQLAARFSATAKYFLVYGSKRSVKPNYDIERFPENIPTQLSTLSLGSEELIPAISSAKDPLFKNKIWLVAVIVLIGILLGYASYSMMRRRDS